jgi:hypothetical protein
MFQDEPSEDESVPAAAPCVLFADEEGECTQRPPSALGALPVLRSRGILGPARASKQFFQDEPNEPEHQPAGSSDQVSSNSLLFSSEPDELSDCHSSSSSEPQDKEQQPEEVAALCALGWKSLATVAQNDFFRKITDPKARKRKYDNSRRAARAKAKKERATEITRRAGRADPAIWSCQYFVTPVE